MTDHQRMPEPGNSPEQDELNIQFAQAAWEVGLYLNRTQRTVQARPSKEDPGVFDVVPYYVSESDMSRVVGIEPRHASGSGSYSDDYRLMVNFRGFSSIRKRRRGTKDWEDVEADEVPDAYKQVMLVAKSAVEFDRAQRAQKVGKKSKGFLGRLRRR